MADLPQNNDDLFRFYRYEPSIPAAVVFIVLFFTISTVHIWQIWRSRNWICICLAVGGILEVQSYITRIISANEGPNYTLGLFIAQAFGSLVGPAVFAASIYVCLGRIIASVEGEQYSLIRLSLLTKFFIFGDVVGLCIQVVGAIYMPMGTYASYIKGSNIVIGGLALLTFYITLFMITTAIFHVRIIRSPTALSLSSKTWQRSLIILYVTSFLIFVRSIYRLIEYSGGNNSVLMRSELTLYILDATLMWLLLVIFAIWQPVRRGAKEDDETRKGEFGLSAWRKKRGHGESVSSTEVGVNKKVETSV